jgi:hypothetical protein
MLEGADAKVQYIQYTPEMEEARSRVVGYVEKSSP